MIVLNILYLFIISYAFGLYFNKKFYESLTPSIILHGIITLISWFIFDDMRIGCYSYIFFSLIYVLYYISMDIFINKRLNFDWFKDKTIIVFLLMFIYLCIINYGRRFFHWDEYSHWGMFIKETFRLNQYFSVSTLPFSHKDYVSLTTIIIYNFLKVAGKFTEPLCFTAMTVFLFSMILPIFSYIKFDNKKIVSGTNLKSIAFILFLILIPYYIPYTYFYISVMTDTSVGVALFYCLYTAYSNKNAENKYGIFILTLSMTSLALVRMEGIALIPVVLLFMFIFGNKRLVDYIIPVVISVIIWAVLNIYIHSNYVNSGIQGYGSVNFTEILDVITLNTNNIPHVRKLLLVYISMLANSRIFFRLSYIASGLVAIITIILIGYFSKERKLYLAAVGVFIAYIYKAVLMFFLYATRFSEAEALALAGYDRYMSNFVMGMYFFMAFVIIQYYYNTNCRLVISFFIASYICVLVHSTYVIANNVDLKHRSYSQVIEIKGLFQYCPGFLMKNFRQMGNDNYDKFSEELEQLYKRGNKILLVMMNKDFSNWVQSTILQYYVDGHALDILYLDSSKPEELIERINLYDYLFTINDAENIVKTNESVMKLIGSDKLENLQIVPIMKN